MLIPACDSHVIKRIDVQRKPLGVDVIIETLCGQQGKVRDLVFEFVEPTDIGCVGCQNQILQIKARSS